VKPAAFKSPPCFAPSLRIAAAKASYNPGAGTAALAKAQTVFATSWGLNSKARRAPPLGRAISSATASKTSGQYSSAVAYAQTRFANPWGRNSATRSDTCRPNASNKASLPSDAPAEA